MLFLLQSRDQVDFFGLAAAEYLARWALMIQQATHKNPKAPVFIGLDHYLSHTFDETGGVVTSDFSQFIASEQRAKAQVLKQQRLWAEEQEKDDDRRTKGGGGGGGGGGNDSNEEEQQLWRRRHGCRCRVVGVPMSAPPGLSLGTAPTDAV